MTVVQEIEMAAFALCVAASSKSFSHHFIFFRIEQTASFQVYCESGSLGFGPNT
jgi:hypothetical protein